MLWLIVLALCIWCCVQQQALNRLRMAMESLLAAPRAGAPPPVPVVSSPVGSVPAAPASDPDDPYEKIRQALEVARAKDAGAEAPAPSEPPRQPTVLAFPQPPAALIEPAPGLPPEPRPEPVAAMVSPVPPEPRPDRPRLSLETWLAENGLAWLGGGALVIGGALLIGFAAQQGLFTPPVRIACATLLGALLVAAGEGARAGRLGRFGEHPLAAAIASGAGAAVLYGAAWAAHALYHFIPAGASGGLLAAIAAGLLALALNRGQPLALLALAGAFAAPAVAAGGGWPAPAMTAYLGILVAAGFTVAAWKGWRASGALTFAGTGLWGLLALFEPSSLKCLLLGLEPLAVLVALTQAGRLRGARAFAGPAVIFASVLGWASMAAAVRHETSSLLYGAAAVLGLAPLAALAVRLRLAKGEALIAPFAAVLLAALLSAAALRGGARDLALPALWLGQGSLLVAAGLAAVWTRGPRAPVLAFGAVVLALLGALGGGWIGAGLMGALPPLAAAAVLALALAALSPAPAAKDDLLAAEFLSGAAASALLLAIALGAGWRFAPAAFAAAAVFLAAGYRRFGWRSLASAAGGAGVIAFGALFTPGLWSYAFSGWPGALWELASSLTVSAAALLAARVIRPRGGALADGVATLAPVAALAGLFVFLRWFAAGGAGYLIDPLAEAALRTLLLAVAGLGALRMLTPNAGVFAQGRAGVLLAAAAVHGVFVQVLALNPLLGAASPVVAGPPVLDSLALAYLAPGLIFAVAAWRPPSVLRGPERAALGWTGGLFLLAWAGLEIRRLAVGADLSGGPYTVGPAEAAAYALMWLAAARIAGRFTAKAGAGLTWFALFVAVWMLGLWSNPWFGDAARALRDPVEAVLAWLGYGLTAAALWRLSRRMRQTDAPLAFAAEASSVLIGLLLVALLIRWGFRGDDLRFGQPHIAAEIWSYSAAGAGLGVALMAARKAGQWLFRYGLALILVTAAKVLFFDMAQLSGMVRVASFIAVGLIMLGAAMTARRVGRSGAEGEVSPSPSGS